MPALRSVLSWSICLFGFLSAACADHGTGDPSPDKEKKIEIRVMVDGDDVDIEALEDGKKIELEGLDAIHGLLEHLPAAGLDAEVKAIVVGEEDQAGAKELIEKIIKILPHHGDEVGHHAAAHAHDTLKSILKDLPADGKVQALQTLKIVRLKDEKDDDQDRPAEHSRPQTEGQKRVTVFLNRVDKEDEKEDKNKNKKVMIVRVGEGDEGVMRWQTSDDNQLIFSPQDTADMALLQLQPTGKFKLGVALTPIGGLVCAQLRIADDVGIAVAAVMEDSPAAKAGLRKYDIIVSINDSEVRELSDLTDAIDKAGENETAVELTIIRGGDQQTISATPESNEAATKSKRKMEWRQKPGNESTDADSLQDLRKQLQELRAAIEELRKAGKE